MSAAPSVLERAASPAGSPGSPHANFDARVPGPPSRQPTKGILSRQPTGSSFGKMRRQQSASFLKVATAVSASNRLRLYSREARQSKEHEQRQACCKRRNSFSAAADTAPAGGSGGVAPKRRSSFRRNSGQFTSEIAAQLRRSSAAVTQKVMGSGVVAHSDAAAKLLAKRVRGKRLTWRESIFLSLEEPTASTASFGVGLGMWVVLLL